MAPWGSVSIEASTLDRSEEGEALVKDGQEKCCPFFGKALFPLQLCHADWIRRTTVLRANGEVAPKADLAACCSGGA